MPALRRSRVGLDKVLRTLIVFDPDPDVTHAVVRACFMQNLRRGDYELGLDAPVGLRIAAALTELALAI
jgi:hypothetical protein